MTVDFSNEQSDIKETFPSINRHPQVSAKSHCSAHPCFLFTLSSVRHPGVRRGTWRSTWYVPGCVFVCFGLPFPTNFWIIFPQSFPKQDSPLRSPSVPGVHFSSSQSPHLTEPRGAQPESRKGGFWYLHSGVPQVNSYYILGHTERLNFMWCFYSF